VVAAPVLRAWSQPSAAEIGEMTFKDRMEGVFFPWKMPRLLLFQYGSILYTPIEYYCENGTVASKDLKQN